MNSSGVATKGCAHVTRRLPPFRRLAVVRGAPWRPFVGNPERVIVMADPAGPTNSAHDAPDTEACLVPRSAALRPGPTLALGRVGERGEKRGNGLRQVKPESRSGRHDHY
jgi:hypothetical protein